MNPQEILKQLEENLYEPLNFLWFGHVYSHLIESRLNLFKHKNQWAIVAERLGYSERGGPSLSQSISWPWVTKLESKI